MDNCQVQELLATHEEQVTLVSEHGGPVLNEGMDELWAREAGKKFTPLPSSTLARQELPEATLLALLPAVFSWRPCVSVITTHCISVTALAGAPEAERCHF